MKLAWRLPTASRMQIRLVLVFTRLSSISVRKKKCASSSKTFLLRLKTALKLQNAAMVTIKLGKPQLPIFPTPDGMSLKDYMAQLAREGLDRRLKVLYPDEKKR